MNALFEPLVDRESSLDLSQLIITDDHPVDGNNLSISPAVPHAADQPDTSTTVAPTGHRAREDSASSALRSSVSSTSTTSSAHLETPEQAHVATFSAHSTSSDKGRTHTDINSSTSSSCRAASISSSPRPSSTFVLSPASTRPPSIVPRQSRTSLLRAGIDPNLIQRPSSSASRQSTSSANSFHVPGTTPSSASSPSIASIRPPTIEPRQNRASLVRQGKLPLQPPVTYRDRELRRASSVNMGDQRSSEDVLQGIPGHKRRESIAVASTQPPAQAPRQTRASMLRAMGDDEAYQLQQRKRTEVVLERKRAEKKKEDEEEGKKVVIVEPKKPLASLRSPTIAPRQSRASLLRLSGVNGEKRGSSSEPVAQGRSSRASSVNLLTTAGSTKTSSTSTLSSSIHHIDAKRSHSSSAASTSTRSSVVSSTLPPVYSVKQTRATLLRAGIPVPPPSTPRASHAIDASTGETLTKASDPDTSRTILRPPRIEPRPNKASTLREYGKLPITSSSSSLTSSSFGSYVGRASDHQRSLSLMGDNQSRSGSSTSHRESLGTLVASATGAKPLYPPSAFPLSTSVITTNTTTTSFSHHDNDRKHAVRRTAHLGVSTSTFESETGGASGQQKPPSRGEKRLGC